MKRTTSAQIGGRGFTLDEDAYAELRGYLRELGGALDIGERKEVLEDIESRIAEYFWEWRGQYGMVVGMEEVIRVQRIMGLPEDFAEDRGPRRTDRATAPPKQGRARRRLYRDGRQKVLGGVCSGIGHLVGVDPVVIRLIALLTLLFGGAGLWIYLILWIAIPRASTRAERLEMMGQEVNAENLNRDI